MVVCADCPPVATPSNGPPHLTSCLTGGPRPDDHAVGRQGMDSQADKQHVSASSVRCSAYNPASGVTTGHALLNDSPLHPPSVVCTGRYDPRDVPVSEKKGATIGMSMTEKQGGSDVRANTTTAVPLVDGRVGPGEAYRIHGHKWFTSAPMCDAFLTLAQTPKVRSPLLSVRVCARACTVTALCTTACTASVEPHASLTGSAVACRRCDPRPCDVL
jgi:hypothetical protein